MLETKYWIFSDHYSYQFPQATNQSPKFRIHQATP
jgi:hypothetical protein